MARKKDPAKNRANVRAWRLANPEKKKAMDAAYRRANVEKLRIADAAKYQRNKARRDYQSKLWVKRHPERRAEISKKYSASHRTEIRIHSEHRRAAKRNALHPERNTKLIAALYREAQRLTSKTGVRWSVDHIIPCS